MIIPKRFNIVLAIDGTDGCLYASNYKEVAIHFMCDLVFFLLFSSRFGTIFRYILDTKIIQLLLSDNKNG